MPAYITAIAWLFIFNGEYGLLNNILGVPRHPDRIAWLSTFPWYYISPIIVNVWLGVPFMMVALLGGLQSIPVDQYEAATVDGASRTGSRSGTSRCRGCVPSARPSSCSAAIWTFNLFAVIYFITGGGPAGKTDILVTFTVPGLRPWRVWRWRRPTAYIIFSLLLVFSLVYRRMARERREDDTMKHDAGGAACGPHPLRAHPVRRSGRSPRSSGRS